MKNIICYTLLGLGLIFSSNANAQVPDKNELEAKIDALIPPQVNDTTPGLVIGIVQKGELVFSKGYGLANMAYGMPNDPNMVYNIGSVSKQFLGYAFALLHVKGDLNIDDPVNKYLEDWPEFKHTVTLRHLLSHTSGYREAYTMSNLAGRIVGVDRLSRDECLDVVRKQPELEFIPGSRYTYNSTAWVILAEILEKVTGQAADEWVETNILQALEMNDTQIESYVGEVIVNTAESYSFDKEKGFVNEKSNRAIFGAAEVSASIPDLVKWINNYRSAEIGGKAVRDLFLDPFILNDGLNSEYALGIGVGSYRGLKRYRHTGGHEAFASQLSYYPDYDLGIITISNYGGRGWLATSKIADLLLEEYIKPESDKIGQAFEISRKELEQLEGLYLASSLNRTLDLKIAKDTLTIGGRTKLIPVSKNIFRVKGGNNQIQVKKLSNGRTELSNSRNETFTKVEEWTPDKEELRSFEGDYWSDELETVYHLIVKDGNLRIKHRWIGEVSLKPISKDIFKTDWGYFVKFNRNKEGGILNLSISSGRTLNVVFNRKE
ncbi:beta-lactamase family protein [Ancylomarina sp. DW003]|nr:serine hydrolase domain-containing protein [Ancylomarina sp. DW003]MDE5423977.1 beta-lactamase family protein [Ancylomarina sp. DW003]